MLTEPDHASGHHESEEAATLRTWLMQKAVEQTAIRLTTQAASLEALQSRATSILGWAITLMTALVALAVEPQWRFPALTGAIFALCCAAIAIIALWPRRWGADGRRFADFEGFPGTTQSACLEAMARGNDEIATENDERLKVFAQRVAACWITLVLVPVSALAVLGWASLAHP